MVLATMSATAAALAACTSGDGGPPPLPGQHPAAGPAGGPTPPASVAPPSAGPPTTAAPAGGVAAQPVRAPLRAPKPQPRPAPGTPCADTARACVDLSASKAWLLDGGQVAYGPVPISTGRAGEDTPAGTFRVQWKDKDHRSNEFNNAPMPYAVFFHQGYAFHADSVNVESAGCIHLPAAAARTFFNSLAVGDVVQIVP
jgi:lipoprotein-anchoring transpeptidase ErfK/SrfK